jgi:ferredoxin
MERSAPKINHELCEGCGLCAENCPAQFLIKTEMKITYSDISDNGCIYCGDCESSCVKGAIRCPVSIHVK